MVGKIEQRLYGIGDIEKVTYSREMAIDFEKAYGIPLKEEVNKQRNIRQFDSLKAKWEVENMLHTYHVNKIRANPEMYAEHYSGEICWGLPTFKDKRIDKE